MSKSSFKRRLYLTLAASSFLFRNWTIRKKLYIGFASLIAVLALNVILTSYEISRLDISLSKLSYLVYLDIMGIVTGCLFIWIISQSVLRPMRRIIRQLEEQNSLDSLQHYYNDEIGQLARAVGYMKKKSEWSGSESDEEKLLLEAILKASMEGIFIFNHQGELTSSSQGFKQITGYSSKEPKKMLSEVVFDLNLEKAFDYLGEKNESPFYIQRVFSDSKGKKNKLFECSICRVEGSDSEMYIGILKKVSGRKRFQESLKKISSLSLKKNSQ